MPATYVVSGVGQFDTCCADARIALDTHTTIDASTIGVIVT
jgi:hypothetical protein